MLESANYTIELRARGEEAVYSEQGHEYHFDVTWRNDIPKVYDDEYWDATGSSRQPVSKNLRDVIVPRIYDFLKHLGVNTPVGVTFLRDAATGEYRRITP